MAEQHLIPSTEIRELSLCAFEASALLSIQQETLERMAARHQVPALRIAGRWYFPMKRLDAWVTLRYGYSAGLLRCVAHTAPRENVQNGKI
jgi:hypothetical protein